MARKVKGLRRIEATEADILKTICDYMDWSNILYIRVNPVSPIVDRKMLKEILYNIWNHRITVIEALNKILKSLFRKIRPTQLGAPDLLVFQDYGKKDHIGYAYPVSIEVKTRTGKLSPDQVKWKKLADNIGLDYYIVRSLEELELVLG